MRIDELPAALDHWEDIASRLDGRTPALFLDFDGTLSPIVDDPAAAALPDTTREALVRLRRRCWVALMSGRDADDVRGRVGLDELVYAGSHGFDVIWPDGRREQRGTEHLETLRDAERRLREALQDIPGAELEPKRFAIAVHYRRVSEEHVADVESALARVADAVDGLRRTGGKKVFELRPDMEWDKGRALLWLLGELELDRADVLPIYLGDDLTDEDGFAALAEHGDGLGLLVRGEADDRSTLADYAIPDVEGAGEVLERLAATLEQRS
jgi:trehalose 6-phosphate phosphatase